MANLEKRLEIGNIFVPPAPGNSGTALGAGMLAWHQASKNPRRPAVRYAHSGPSCDRNEVKDVLDNCKARYAHQTTVERKLEATLQLLHTGKIVGWFQGAAEFGPRALGNRSLLASPWAAYVKENLNDYIKHREWFRPFAVAVREDDCARYFECSQLCQSMNSLATVKPGTNILPEGFVLPGNFVRLQIVQQQSNPLLWRLLKRFGEQAPAPFPVNTLFNLFGKPLVVKPGGRRTTQLFLLRHRCSCGRQFCLVEISGETSARLSRLLEGFLELTFQLFPRDFDPGRCRP